MAMMRIFEIMLGQTLNNLGKCYNYMQYRIFLTS
jgi:hypothetical protein